MTNGYALRPLMVYWEMTRACDLACQHCRAEAISSRHPDELTTEEGYALLRELVRFGEPLPNLVLTGGDPLKRPDVFDYVSYARGLGFNVAITPSGTTGLTEEKLRRLREAGAWMLALSLDGSTAERHDTLRGVQGSFAQTTQAARWARAAGLPLQVNTLVCAETLEDLPSVYATVSDIGVTQWALFFLIRVGRGVVLREVSPEEAEGVMRWVESMSARSPFRIRTTEAPFYRRVALQQATAARRNGEASSNAADARRAFGVWDGNGVMFVSHIGEIYPAGFLPLVAGHVRRDDPVDVYRESPLFLSLRDPDQWRGKCGLCEYRQVCGGSRARAYAATGDYLGSDPLCSYQPVAPGQSVLSAAEM